MAKRSKTKDEPVKSNDDYPFDKSLMEEEEDLSSQDDSAEVPPTDIVAYNELRSCADLVRMYKNGQLDIQPDFQRDFVWKRNEQSRFIDSLIKQLPIPSMCVSFDFNTNERQVIDGLQRISTIINFLTNNDFQISDLDDIDPKISGKTVSVIKSKNRTLYERVENLTIPITVLRCDYSKQSHMDYLFTIFHRLNSGGSKLNNQEIRNCIYSGSLNTLLKETVKYPNYKKLMDIEEDKTYRFAFEELNLRFFAFSDWLNKYNGRLARFLNTYMFDHKKSPSKEIEKRRKYFIRTIDLAYTKVFDGKPVDKLSKTALEAVLVGIGSNLDYIDSITKKEATALLAKFRIAPEFSADSLKEGLSAKARVISRIKRSIEIFSGK
ncbi:DUF262 domain-containing protein [Chitinophaga pendula]|uniref:DUF262 domain-containing protein n=1 Tax=Chitinophaga TaxID=79328 RepID=UPI000BAF5F0D|nr:MULTISPECIES: DUF262 domain-containing protein [Chitinophaga]ASZ11187.1 hypothetical protein CK934_09535 [Chitinophaga sp. MD30]UCJ05817.1 DUF262 domain-containing protein [Chitinophaga pendula]